MQPVTEKESFVWDSIDIRIVNGDASANGVKSWSETATKVLKVSVVAIAYVGVTIITYSHFDSYLKAVVVIVPLSIYAVSHCSKNVSHEKLLRQVLLVTSVVLGSLLTAGIANSVFVTSCFAYSFFAELNVGWGLINTVLATGLVGFGGPFCSALFAGSLKHMSDSQATWAKHVMESVRANREDKSWMINKVFRQTLLTFLALSPELFQEFPHLNKIILDHPLHRNILLGTSLGVSQLFTYIEDLANSIGNVISHPGIVSNSLPQEIQAIIIENVDNHMPEGMEFDRTLAIQLGFKYMFAIPLTESVEQLLQNTSISLLERHLSRIENILLQLHNMEILNVVKIPDRLQQLFLSRYDNDLSSVFGHSLETRFSELESNLTACKDLEAFEGLWTDWSSFRRDSSALLEKAHKWRCLREHSTLETWCDKDAEKMEQEIERLTSLHRIALGVDSENDFFTKINKLRNQYQADTHVDEVLAYEILGDYNFSAGEYNALCEKLQVDSTDFERMQIALQDLKVGTEKDLIKAKIIWEGAKKFEVIGKLYDYIENPPVVSKDVRTQLYEWLSSSSLSSEEGRMQLSSHFFRVITGAQVLLPLAAKPTVGMVFFSIGVSQVALRKMTTLGHHFDWVRSFVESNRDVSALLELVSKRNFIHVTEHTRTNMKHFAEAPTFGKMRIIAVEFFFSLSITYAYIGNYPNSMNVGIPIQGIALGSELANYSFSLFSGRAGREVELSASL